MILSVFKDIEEQIINRISSSKHSVFVAVAWFTNQLLLESLVAALKRNVVVNVLILEDILNRNEFGLDFGILTKLGAEVRFAKSGVGTMHHKFCIIDDLVITGSYNWTYHANKNCENILMTDEESVVNSFTEEFDKLFSEATAISQPYEHLKWTDVKEGDFSELRRNIFRDVIAKNDENRDLKRIKLINLDHAYKSGNTEELAKAVLLPTEEHLRTITDVLTSRSQDLTFKLWEENRTGKPYNNVDGHINLGKWIFLPYDIIEETNNREYIKGELKTYSSRYNIMAGGLNLGIYDKQFVEVIKKYDNKKRGYDWYKDIPEKILCIEYAQMFFYQFPSPMFNKSQPRTWGNRNTTQRTISAINLLGIAKKVDRDSITFYEGWDPQERGRMIQNKFFSK